jgi:hypothetical protein
MLIPFEGTVHLNHSSKMKIIKKSQSHKTIESRVFLHICFLMEVGPGSRSVQINYRSRFRRPKNIRIRIRNTGWQDYYILFSTVMDTYCWISSTFTKAGRHVARSFNVVFSINGHVLFYYLVNLSHSLK